MNYLCQETWAERNRTEYASPARTSPQLWWYALDQLQLPSLFTVSPKPSDRALEGNRHSDLCVHAPLFLVLP